MGDIVKCSVLDQEEKVPPLIVSFEHGNLNFNENSAPLDCALYKDVNDFGRRIVAMKTDSLLYKSVKNSNITDKIDRTLIAFRNRRTNKMRIVEAEFHRLAPYLHTNLMERAGDEATVQSKVAALNRTFGSKRARIHTERVEKTKVNINVNHLVQISHDTNITASDLNLSDSSTQGSLTEHLPPYNSQATDPREVYKLEGMLTPDEMDILDKKCDEILNVSKEYDIEQHSKFFKTYFRIMKQRRDRTLLKALLYADCIVNLMEMSPFKLSKVGHKDLSICRYSDVIQSGILSKFTESTPEKRVFTHSKTDKAMCYLIILGLMISDFKFDLEQLMDVSRFVGIRKLLELSRAVGAVSSKEKKTTVILKVPLPKLDMVKKRFNDKKRK